MGIYIRLPIEPALIEPSAWALFYDEALSLLRQHPDGLMSRRSKNTTGGTRDYYSRDLEFEPDDPHERHLMVCGDRASRQFAEWFYLYRDLEHYRPGRPGEVPDDILRSLANEEARTVSVFSDKTQGYPYHFPMLAAALLAEDTFPLGAHASGDIDRAQAERARTWAQEVLGRPLALPVAVDASALWRRLTRFLETDAAVEAFERLYRGERHNVLEALLPLLGADAARRWLCRALRDYKSPTQLGVLRTFIDWLNTTGDLATLLEAACLDPAGPRFPQEEVIRAVTATWTTLEPGLLEFLQPLTPPAGHAGSVWAQMLGALLDMDSIGRHIRRHIPWEEAAALVRQVFPAQAEALETLLREETVRRTQALEAVSTPVTERLREAQESATELNPERLLTCATVLELPEAQQQYLRWFTFRVMEVGRQLEQDSQLSALTEGKAEKMRAFMLYLLEQRFVLTEEAWQQIDEETDEDMLRFLITLGAFNYNELEFSETRTRVLENAGLRRSLVQLMRDPTVYEATAREVEEVRRAAESSTGSQDG